MEKSLRRVTIVGSSECPRLTTAKRTAAGVALTRTGNLAIGSIILVPNGHKTTVSFSVLVLDELDSVIPITFELKSHGPHIFGILLCLLCINNMDLAPYKPSETARSFRKMSVFLSLGGLVLVIIVAPIAHYAILLVGLLPLIYSLLLALLISRLDKRKNPTKVVAATLDVLGALSYFGALIPVWIGRLRASNSERSYSDIGLAIPITYASSVYIAQM